MIDALLGLSAVLFGTGVAVYVIETVWTRRRRQEAGEIDI